MSKRSKRRAAQKGTVIDRTTFVLLIAALILVLGGGTILLTSQQSNGVAADFVPEYTGGPRLDVAELVHDHGDVKFSEPVESVFRLRNVGDQVLNILGEPPVSVLEGC